MGKRNKKPKGPQFKVITGSGADVASHEDEQGKVKCKCIIPCVWRGYRDEGDTVWIEKELIEKDDFIRAHFEEVKSEELRVKSSDNADGEDGNEDSESENENDESENENDESDNADSGSDDADGSDGNADGGSDDADGAVDKGQGELDLK